MDFIDLLGWTATTLLLIGYYFNAKKYIYSWIIWMAGNSIMLIYALLIQSNSLAFLSIVLVFLNIFGWHSWRKPKE